jgi:hypothetical protein
MQISISCHFLAWQIKLSEILLDTPHLKVKKSTLFSSQHPLNVLNVLFINAKIFSASQNLSEVYGLSRKIFNYSYFLGSLLD